MTHTPGPWSRKGTTVLAKHGFTSYPAKKTICTVRPYPRTDAAWDEALDNAELIASAPSLKAENERLRAALEYIRDLKPETVAKGFLTGPKALLSAAQRRAHDELAKEG